jgi:hypothetical protein
VAEEAADAEGGERVTECWKFAFPTRTAARKAIKNPRARHLQPYECHFCGQWHLTSKSPRQFKQQKTSMTQ